MSEAAIRVDNVGKSYRDGSRPLEILKRVSFTVGRGEGVAILGPSGSGKTTLLNILSGLDAPSEGTVSFDGRKLGEMSESEKALFRNQSIGFVFQFYHLLPELTALENVMLPALMGGRKTPVSDARNHAGDLLRRVGLGDRVSHFPAELSGGEQQRVAIARALVNDPPFVLCDEPTGNLDRARAAEIAELLADLFRRRHKTVLIVTHDERIARMADKIWDLTAGRWRESLEPQGGAVLMGERHEP